MPKDDAPLDARTVARLLGVSISTMNCWLAADEERHPEDRRFAFHSYRGRKRVWTADACEALKQAIETESEPDGCLGGWRNADGDRGVSAGDAATEAMLRVLGFYDGDEPAAPAHDDDVDGQPAGRKPK